MENWISKLLHHYHSNISSEWVDLTYDSIPPLELSL